MLEHALFVALMHVVTLDNGHYIAHCRHAAEGCEARVAHYAHLIADASDKTGVDPWMIAAKAVLSSGMNPKKTHPLTGAFGLIAIHPKDRLAKTCDATTAAHVPRVAWQSICPRRSRFLTAEETLVRYGATIAQYSRECGAIEGAMLRWSTGSCGGTDHPLYSKKVTLIRRTASNLRVASEILHPASARYAQASHGIKLAGQTRQ